MSAWIVSKEHIDHMVTELVARGAEIAPNELGRILWRENLRSVAARYPYDTDGSRPGPVDFRDNFVDTYEWAPTTLMSDGGVAKTFGCWDFQSCETNDFEQSQAYQIVHHVLPEKFFADDGVGYDDSVPWGW